MNIVRELRKKAGIQQKELALIIGVAQPTISDWEANKKDPSGERLKKLAEYFGVDELEILGAKKEPSPPMDEDLKTLIEKFQQLYTPEKAEILAYITWRLSTHEQ